MKEDGVVRVAVDVMLKREILDPQGQAVERALPALGFAGVSDVRIGKHVELTVGDGDGETAARQVAEALLANPVIEEFSVHLLPL
jgi:phosphoribosylformylglycinamidine synthase PurS subunit